MRNGAETSGKRVVSARIHDNYVQPVMGVVHFAQYCAHIHRLVFDLLFMLDCRPHGEKVVVPVHLDPVPGIVEKPDATLLELFPENLNLALHLFLVQVFLQRNLEGEVAERLCHGTGIVDGISKRSGCIAGVADDQGRSFLWLVRSCLLICPGRTAAKYKAA